MADYVVVLSTRDATELIISLLALNRRTAQQNIKSGTEQNPVAHSSHFKILVFQEMI